MAVGFRYGLGLDQGVGSIGWSILRLNDEGRPIAIERLGVHTFEAGTEGDVVGGRDQSRATPRRLARQSRRQLARRVMRKKALLKCLQAARLLPAGEVGTPSGRQALFADLDATLRAKWESGSDVDHRERQLLPYRLRAAGLTRRLEPWELGRALYHLAQRRGYLSNRLQETGGDESSESSAGVVLLAIGELTKQMRGAGCSTLAEYFSSLDPSGVLEHRIRGRWTAREMFLEEFNRLCDAQAPHHPVLTSELRRRLYRAIFFQRPLKSASGLVGECSLLRGRKRAPLGHLLCQRFRLLQQVNSLLIEFPDHTSRPLAADERSRLIAALESTGDLSFSKLRQKNWFALPKESRFNLERGDNKRLVGNRTAAKCREIFGPERWDAMLDVEREAVVQDLLVFLKPSALARRGVHRWGLSADQANRLADCTLESGYSAHCIEAIRRLIERMKDGTPYMTAVKEEFGLRDSNAEIASLLPPVEQALGQLRNPTVTRALTELRKLVNALIRHYGKPQWIRLELARELKRARKQRERITREMRAREGDRDRARARILAEAGVAQCSRADIDRVLLAEECGWICPYTGKSFGMRDVVGRHPEVDVEHIWPLSRSLDDSFLNKTLCFVEENRRVKGNRTPFEAYSGVAERWQGIIDRVRRFRSDAGRIKLERFQAEEIPEDFAQRHLSETRKIAAASAEYLGRLFGGECDSLGNRRVFVTSGGLTAHLRREWHLDALLSDDGSKSRDDLRHHAVDALVVALTDSRSVQLLQRAAEQASAVGRRMFAPVEEPWRGFLDETRAQVAAIRVSFRQSRRSSGKLHAETNYSRPIGPNGEVRVRKELAKLTERDIPKIVNPTIRDAVSSRIRELGLQVKGPRKEYTDFANRDNHPFVITKAGDRNWIHKVRIVSDEKPWPVGAGPHMRFVSSTQGSNHHVVIRKLPNGKWVEKIIPLMVASREPVGMKRPHGGSEFTLAAGDFVLLPNREGMEELLRVTKISEGQIAMIRHLDGRRMEDIKKAKGVVYKTGASLVKSGGKKVVVTYLGELRRAGG